MRAIFVCVDRRGCKSRASALLPYVTFVGFIAFAIVSAVFQVSASFKLGG